MSAPARTNRLVGPGSGCRTECGRPRDGTGCRRARARPTRTPPPANRGWRRAARSPAGASSTQSRWLIQHCCSSGRPASSRPPAPARFSVGAAELARLGALDAPAERERHRLHAVADAEHRDPELEQLGAQRRGALRVDRGRAAREDQRPGRALADRLQRRVAAAGARRTPRTRGSAGRSAASTGRRSRGPAPPRARSAAARPRASRRGGLALQDLARRGGRTGDLGRSLSHPRRRPPPRPRPVRSSPCRPTASAAAACPRSGAPGATITSARWKSRMSS